MLFNRIKRPGALYLPYIFQNNTQVLGHYRMTTAPQTTSGTVGAAGIVFGAVFGGSSGILAVPLRINLFVEIGTATTVAQQMDFNLYSFRGATGKYTGTSATHVAGLSGAQMRTNMAPSSWLSGSNGDICSLGGSLTGLTAASGKSNSAQPIGSVNFTGLFGSTATGTASVVPVGAALTPPNADIYTLQPGVSHPLVLNANDGIEIQQITASANSLVLKYCVSMEWAEVMNL